MRKVLLGAGLFVGLVAGGLILWPTSASADAGPHGGYDLNTSACAGCHRAHTAPAAELLFESDEYALCTSCHGGVADTNVVDGVLEATGNPRLNGGGFEFVAGVAVTSTHTVEGLPLSSGGTSDGAGTAWGGASSGLGVEGTLSCTGCHNPHGSTNYRILRDSNNGYPYEGRPGWPEQHRWVPSDPQLLDWVDEQVLSTVDDVPANYAAGDHAYYTSGISYDSVTRAYSLDSTAGPPAGYLGMSAFCSTCHKQYLTESHSAGEPSTNADYYFYPGTQSIAAGQPSIERYRHAIARTYTGTPDRPLRFASASVDGSNPVSSPNYSGFQCLQCHFAHGTSAVMEDFAVTPGFDGVAPTYDSALLYYDNRGVCRSCHQRDK